MAINAGNIVVTESAQQLKGYANTGAGKSLLIKAKIGNAKTIWIGGKGEMTEKGKGFPLEAGQSLIIDIDNAGTFWFIGENTTDVLYYLIHGNAV